MDDETRKTIDSIMAEKPQDISSEAEKIIKYSSGEVITKTADGLSIIDIPGSENAANNKPIARKSKPTISECIFKCADKSRYKEAEIVGGFFHKKSFSLLFGEAGKGKSWLVIKLACDLSRGGPIFGGAGYSAEPRKVLIFAGEAGTNLVYRRLKQTGWSFNDENIDMVDSGYIQRERGTNLYMDTDIGKQEMRAFVEYSKPDLIIIDSLCAFLGDGDESKPSVARRVTEAAINIANDYDCAILIIHHSRKLKKAEANLPLTQNDAIGSSIFIRQCASSYALEESKVMKETEGVKEQKEHVVKCTKSWDITPPTFSFVIENEEGIADLTFTVAPSNASESTKKAKFKAFIRAHFKGTGAEFTVGDIIARAKAPDNERQTIRQALAELAEDGELEAKGKQKWRRYIFPLL